MFHLILFTFMSLYFSRVVQRTLILPNVTDVRTFFYENDYSKYTKITRVYSVSYFTSFNVKYISHEV